MSVEKITADGNVLAIIIRGSFSEPGLKFITPDDFPFQLGMHSREAGTHIKAHKHHPFENVKKLEVQEFFYLIEGKMEFGLYSGSRLHAKVTLKKGDAIVLNCPHEMTFLSESKAIEIKQGPYRGRDAEKEELC